MRYIAHECLEVREAKTIIFCPELRENSLWKLFQVAKCILPKERGALSGDFWVAVCIPSGKSFVRDSWDLSIANVLKHAFCWNARENG